MFDDLRRRNFEFEFRSHAAAILEIDFPAAERELSEALSSLTVPVEEIVMSGGGIGKGTQRLRGALAERGWVKTNFTITKTINDGIHSRTAEAISHEIDHVRDIDGRKIALEIEWNNKDPFFDRDLENFKRLHAEGAISIGIVVTRGSSLQSSLKGLIRRFCEIHQVSTYDDLDRFSISPTRRQRNEVSKRMQRKRNPLAFKDAWTEHFVGDKFGTATTHWSKLADRLHRGVGNPCPLVCIGLPADIVTFNEGPAILAELAIEQNEGS
jgi:hypothetical protein